MNLINGITIYELLFLVLTTIGGFFALFQWRQNYKLKRAELLKEALSKIRDEKEFAIVLYAIDYGEKWYTREFLDDHSKEQKFDMVFAYFDYLCYLKNKYIFSKSEFRVFEYRIKRMTRNRSFMNYMFNLYHFSTKNKTDMSFYHLLMYMKKNELIIKDFWNPNSKKFEKLLNF